MNGQETKDQGELELHDALRFVLVGSEFHPRGVWMGGTSYAEDDGRGEVETSWAYPIRTTPQRRQLL